MSEDQLTQVFAKNLDNKDDLSAYREEFYTNRETIYMDGNSLGLMSKRAESSLEKIKESWKKYGIDGWTKGDHPWFYFSDHLANKSAGLIGAQKEEVMVTGSTTSNIHQIVASFFQPSVLYRSGQILDMKRLTQAAHERGILIAFDLCHSIGAMPHQLTEWGVDFAVWCTYKYLNGGPGSVAGVYVNKRHLKAKPGLAGWFSSDKQKQFDMEHTLTAATDASAFQMGTPHMLSAAPLLGSLEMFQEIGMDKVRRHSLAKTN